MTWPPPERSDLGGEDVIEVAGEKQETTRYSVNEGVRWY
jgi:hypothetical protein